MIPISKSTHTTIYRTSGNSITLDEAREYDQHSQKGSIATTPAAIVAPLPTSLSDQTRNEEETRVLSFAELKELIEAGRLDQIPNNKVIPNDLNVRISSLSEERKGLTVIHDPPNRRHIQAHQQHRHARSLGRLSLILTQ